jgi:monoamine oxidase
MIRYAEYTDIPEIVECIKKFTERPPYNERAFDVVHIGRSLTAAMSNREYDVIVQDVDGEIQGAACASRSCTLLCPEWEYHEHFVVALNPMHVRGLVRWLLKRAKEQDCFRAVIGCTTKNERYEKLLQVAGGMQDYGKTFVKEM